MDTCVNLVAENLVIVVSRLCLSLINYSRSFGPPRVIQYTRVLVIRQLSESLVKGCTFLQVLEALLGNARLMSSAFALDLLWNCSIRRRKKGV